VGLSPARTRQSRHEVYSPRMSGQLSRREILTILSAGGVTAAVTRASAQTPLTSAAVVASAVARNDDAVRTLLASQITDSASAWRGSVPGQYGLHPAPSAGGVVETLTASFLHPQSRYHDDAAVLDRIRLAAGYLERSQSPQGFIDLQTTNFNSPPDTGFVVHNVATAAALANRQGREEIAGVLQPFLVKAGAGMAVGGVHTPNHRWVIASALAQINELWPDSRYVHRIDAWLAEGIDIDDDGQFTERSTLVYNIVTDRAFIVMASKLHRPELLQPVRRNLRALQYLLHADGEVVSEISRRQDQFTRGTVMGYWFPLTYMALTDRDGRLATLAARAADGARLSALLEYPELSQPLPSALALPEDFAQELKDIGIARIRRGPLSATMILGGTSRFFTLRYGGAALEGLRFATAFFGKGQFIPTIVRKIDNGYLFRQTLEGPYYQPIAEKITTRNWDETRRHRPQSEVSRIEQSAEVKELKNGFSVRVRAEGTNNVPVAIELGFRDGGQLEGCRPIPDAPGTFVLDGRDGRYRVGQNVIRFGPGDAPHTYTQLRGAEPRLPGQSVYITGVTPFDRTLMIECGSGV
jgi:hypothetical protein